MKTSVWQECGCKINVYSDGSAGGAEIVEWCNLHGNASELLDACSLLLSAEDNSYCEWCDCHAPKNHEGEIVGEIAHDAGCPRVIARDAIEKAGGDK